MEKRQKQDMDAMDSGALGSLIENYSTLYLQSVYYRVEEAGLLNAAGGVGVTT